uniref:Uncharacterized protein n=1 Tax=Brassica campestris TaxID=3711 RepID=M4F307_BRACM
MIDRKRKEFISEEDMATLLQRYDTMTILQLLQEMAYYAEPKMDWNEMVKKTSTGITSARDYQLLWRHLAYRDSLLPNAQSLDDDSDMECELETSPAVNVDAVSEAVAHVKVIASSFVPSDLDIPEDSTFEAPLTINIPYGHRGPQEPSDSYWSSKGMNITFPISLQKAAEGHNGNGLASSVAARKKRKKWSAEEDEELIAAVKRHGEGSWVTISKEEFEGERTVSQLSQRWGFLRKRGDTSNSSTQSGLHRTEEQMAANRALSLAVGNRVPSKKAAVGMANRRSFLANSIIYKFNNPSPDFESSRLAPTQRVPAANVTPQKPNAGAGVTATCKPVGVQTQGNIANPIVTPTLRSYKAISTNSVITTAKPVAAKVETPSLLPKHTQVPQTEVGSGTEKSSLAKPSGKESSTTVSPLVVAEAESKSKGEESKGKSLDVATVTGTEKKGL